MKIVHITKYLPSFSGGIEKATDQMARAGCATGAQVIVHGMGKPLPGTPYEQVSLGTHYQIGPIPVSWKYKQLVKDSTEADILHIHLPNPLVEVSAILEKAAWNHTKLVPVFHADVLHFGKLGAVWTQLIQKQLMALSHCYIFTSPNMVTRCREWFPLVDHKIQIIPWSVPGPHQLRPPKKESHTILAIGRLVPYKGFDFLIQAIDGLKTDYTLKIAGAGPQGEALEKLSHQLELSQRIEFLGEVDEKSKSQLLNTCSVVVLPSQTEAEAFGLVAAEAFAYGKPVVLTDIPTGFAFLARNGACGAVAKAGSVSSLRKALEKLTSDKLLRERAGKANRLFWEKNLQPKHYAKRYEQFLKHLKKTSQAA